MTVFMMSSKHGRWPGCVAMLRETDTKSRALRQHNTLTHHTTYT